MATKHTKSYSENFIRIIDNISRNILPKSSEDIKNRIKVTSTKYKKTDYTLPRGGIAIHLHSEEDVENLENNIGKIYPGSSCTIPLAKQDKSRIVIKNTNPKISRGNNKLHLEISKQYKSSKIFLICKSTSTPNHLYHL